MTTVAAGVLHLLADLLDLAGADQRAGAELARGLDRSADDGGAGGLAQPGELVERFLRVEQGAAAVLHGDQNGPVTGLCDVDHCLLDHRGGGATRQARPSHEGRGGPGLPNT